MPQGLVEELERGPSERDREGDKCDDHWSGRQVQPVLNAPEHLQEWSVQDVYRVGQRPHRAEDLGAKQARAIRLSV